MIKIGEWNHLEVVKEKDFGIYLAEKKYDDEEVLLPKKQDVRKYPSQLLHQHCG